MVIPFLGIVKIPYWGELAGSTLVMKRTDFSIEMRQNLLLGVIFLALGMVMAISN